MSSGKHASGDCLIRQLVSSRVAAVMEVHVFEGVVLIKVRVGGVPVGFLTLHGVSNNPVTAGPSSGRPFYY